VRTTPENINTPDYWDGVYDCEARSGDMERKGYHRDYGPIHDAILRVIPGSPSVLDVACGPGILCRKIRTALPGSRVVGVDFSRTVIERNRERDRALGIDYRHLDIREGMESLGRGFGVVTMCEILEHLDDPEAVVHSAIGRLVPGGRFILTCPHDDQIPDPEHVREWGHDEVFHLLAPYSDTVSFVHFPPPYFHIWMMAYLDRTKMPGTESE
jgi:SAM-dependent methyltransferase